MPSKGDSLSVCRGVKWGGLGVQGPRLGHRHRLKLVCQFEFKHVADLNVKILSMFEINLPLNIGGVSIKFLIM